MEENEVENKIEKFYSGYNSSESNESNKLNEFVFEIIFALAYSEMNYNIFPQKSKTYNEILGESNLEKLRFYQDFIKLSTIDDDVLKWFDKFKIEIKNGLKMNNLLPFELIISYDDELKIKKEKFVSKVLSIYKLPVKIEIDSLISKKENLKEIFKKNNVSFEVK